MREQILKIAVAIYFVFGQMKTNSRDSNEHPFFEAAVFSAR